MESKPKIFVIMPFKEEFEAVFQLFKETFKDDYDFKHAGNLDNQQSILKDIVKGIYEADAIIADLTGLNANVFYELGLAHALNKKVIIITQDIGSLPFDIQSYRAREYASHFYKIDTLTEHLKQTLPKIIDGSLSCGNPVSDFLLEEFDKNKHSTSLFESNSSLKETNSSKNEEQGEQGILDHMSDLEDYSKKVLSEIDEMAKGMNKMTASVDEVNAEIERVQSQSGTLDVRFARRLCKDLSQPVNKFAVSLKENVKNVDEYWKIVENSYLTLLDNITLQNEDDLKALNRSLDALTELRNAIESTYVDIEDFALVLQGAIGVERSLSSAVLSLISELEGFLVMSRTMSSSIDRIQSKANVFKKRHKHIKLSNNEHLDI